MSKSVKVQLLFPEGRVMGSREGDCAVRALSTFLDRSYADVKTLLRSRYGYSPHRGVSLYDFHRLAEDLGLTYINAHIRLNSASAKDKLPKKCILLFGSHVAAYEDGTIFDIGYTTNTSGMKQTKGYFYRA